MTDQPDEPRTAELAALKDVLADGIAAWDDVAGTRDLWRSMPLDRLTEGIATILIARGLAASRPAVRDGLDVERLAEAMHVWTNHEPDGSQALHLTDHHRLGDTLRRDAAGIAREYAALAASRPAVGELDVERLARAIHEVLPEDGDPEHEDNGEPYCEYIAAAIAGRYDDPEWVALADKDSKEAGE